MSINVAVVGAGRMGCRHIEVVRGLGLKLRGVVDLSSSALLKVKHDYGLGDNEVFSDVRSMYSAVVPECLIVSTTADSHCDIVCEAASRGVKYILVEKPFAVSLAQCKKMIEICEKNKTRLAVNHQMRFMEQYVKPKELLGTSLYGGFKSMTVVAGNFGLSMNGTHYIEAFRYLTDDIPVEVTAWFSPDDVPNPRGEKFKDRAGSLRITTRNGKRFYMEASADQGHGLQVIYAGRNGSIFINELTGEMIETVRKPEFSDLPTTRYGMPATITQTSIAPAELMSSTGSVLQALLTGKNNVDAECGLLAVMCLLAAYTSAENGSKPIRLDGDLDEERIFPWA